MARVRVLTWTSILVLVVTLMSENHGYAVVSVVQPDD
jgi:hypothetical protein